MIKLKHFPSPILYYAVAIMVINKYKLHHIWKCSYVWDEKQQLWINIKFRTTHNLDPQFLTTIGQTALRWIHGSTPGGYCGVIANGYENFKGAILPQMGSASAKRHVPNPGFFAAAYEIQYNSEAEYSELKATLEKFSGHKKNQINIGLTGTIQGQRHPGNTASWASQLVLLDNKELNMVNGGGRINCIRATEATLDGVWIKSTAAPPYKYDYKKPFNFANL